MENNQTKIKIEDLSTIQKKFTVTIPASLVSKTVEKKYLEAQKTAKLKGFRPGKVPLNLVKQYYGEDVKNRALQDLVSNSYREALTQHPLRAVGDPQFEGAKEKDHLHIHDGEELSYVAIVDVVPEIEPKDYKGLSLEKIKPEVQAEDLEKMKKNLLDRKAELTPIQKPAKMGDFVDFKYEGKLKTDQGVETPANLSGDRFAEIGSGQLLPEFEKNIIGISAGETKSFKIDYPKDYADAQLAGKAVDYDVSMREVKEKKYPDFTDEYVKEFGYESVGDFETKAKENILKNKTEESEAQFKNQLIEKLVEKNSFEIPQALVYSQMRALADDYSQELRRYGFNDQMIQSAVMNQLPDFKKRAEQQVRAGILLDAIAKKEKIEATEAALEAEISKLASQYQVQAKDLKDRFFGNPREKSNFEFRVREDLTMQFLINAAKVKEKSAK